MGDPGGIGPEVLVKALADPQFRSQARFVIFGLHEFLSYAADLAEVNPFWFAYPHQDLGRVDSGVVVADFDECSAPGPAPHPHPNADAGRASLQFLDAAIMGANEGWLDAIVTGPIHKTSWQLAGCRAPGHTEYLAGAFGVSRFNMAFVGGPVRVVLASTHLSMFEMVNQLSIGTVFQAIDLMDEALRKWFGFARPRLAVAALNPHAGENQRFGDEEQRIIEPAILMAREAGIHADGPHPADTLFWRASHGEFDGVVALYHDQALIPIKLLAFESAVNVTLGLPIIRTSVDHGTAFNIAGKNLADAGSMTAAIRLAVQLARQHRRQSWTARVPQRASDPPSASGGQ